jgi:hypothetical protein
MKNYNYIDTKRRVQKFREFVLHWITCTSWLQKLFPRTVLTWREEPGTYYRDPGSHYRDIYLLTAVGLTPGGSSTVHIYTQTVHINTFTLGRVWAVPRLCELCPGICLTTEEKVRKNFSQGSRRVPVGTMKTEYIEQNIHNNKNTWT